MYGLCLNEDDSNFYMSFQPADMTREGLEKFIMGYAQGQVKAIYLNPNAQRCSYESKVIEPIWAGVDTDEDGRPRFCGKTLNPNAQLWVTNARLLHERGLNPYQVWLETIRPLGIEGWISCRMNDVHCVDDDDCYMHDRFWREHPEYRRAQYMGGNWFGRALDYSFSEVREYRLALIAEYLELFDCDGIELDWLRFPAYLKAGCELEDAPVITELVREVRRMAHEAELRRHHPVRVAVRLPSRPDDARRLGLDFMAWAQDELIDVVTVSNFWPTTDSDMPLEIWRRLLGDKLELNAGFDINIGACPEASMMLCTDEITAGFASEYWYRGADHVYLFNYMNGKTGMQNPEGFQKVLENCGSPATACAMSRRHVLTYAVPRPVGMPMDCSLPRTLGGWQAFRLNVGGETSYRTSYAVLGLEAPLADGQSLEVRVNGELCVDDEELGLKMPPHVAAVVSREIPRRVLHDGDNVIETRLVGGGSAKAVWCEIFIK